MAEPIVSPILICFRSLVTALRVPWPLSQRACDATSRGGDPTGA